MARPVKMGIDYFPLNVYLDDSIELIEAEFGLEGFAVVVKLWQKIYAGFGYYCEWNDEVALLFAKRIGVRVDDVCKILNALLKRGIFDDELYRKYGILTSRGIQKRYLEITARRSRVNLEKKFLLISIPPKATNVYIDGVNVCNMNTETPVNSDDNTQSKEKKIKENKIKENESKENKIKEKKIKENEAAEPPRPIPEKVIEFQKPAERRLYGEYKNISLSDEELSRLKKEFPDQYSEYIDRISSYCASTGKFYDNYCATIISWIRRDNEKRTPDKRLNRDNTNYRPNTGNVCRKNAFNNFTNDEETDYNALEDRLYDMMFESP